MRPSRLPVVVLLAVMTACASAPAPRRLEQLSGMEMYQSLCASCHGVSGQGDGPVAPLIKIRVPDLTRIAHRDGGEFPTEDVRRTIDGRYERRTHGPRDMPVWGWQFYDGSAGDDAAERAHVDAMIGQLTEYLRSIPVSF